MIRALVCLGCFFIALDSTIYSRRVFAQAIKTSDVEVGKFHLARFQSDRKKFGKLSWRGGFSLKSNGRGFGGFSGLALSRDGKRFAAVSDRAWWLKGKFVFSGNMLSGVGDLTLGRLRLESGIPMNTHWADSESLAPWGIKGIDGPVLVGFERRERILKYQFTTGASTDRPSLIKVPVGVSSGPFNRELEAIGRFYDGPRRSWMLAISEENLDENGNIRGWTWLGRRVLSFSVKRFEDFAITDLAVAPGGKEFFTLERSFNLPKLPGFAIRRFKVRDFGRTKLLDGELMFAGRQPFFAVDNMEGLAIHKQAGKLYLTLISDDNFRRKIQKTLIFRFLVN